MDKICPLCEPQEAEGIEMIRKLAGLMTVTCLSGCATIYQPPAELTLQTGATLTGIYNPKSTFFSPATHICVGSIDGELPKYGWGEKCDKPLLLTAGTHQLQIAADFYPFPSESGFTTIPVTLAAGQSYYIRATGGPIAFKNTNGKVSLPASGLMVWIEDASGKVVTPKTMIALQAPAETIPIFIPAK